MGIKLSELEVLVCETTPDALEAVAEYHDTQADMAASMGVTDSAEHHQRRAEELRSEARRIADRWEE